MRSSVRRLENTYDDQIDFHILNFDLASSQDLAIKYRVPGIPFIVLLDVEGEVFNTLLGYQTEEQLIEAVEALLDATEELPTEKDQTEDAPPAGDDSSDDNPADDTESGESATKDD
jgi:thioredoxin-related protein